MSYLLCYFSLRNCSPESWHDFPNLVPSCIQYKDGLIGFVYLQLSVYSLNVIASSRRNFIFKVIYSYQFNTSTYFPQGVYQYCILQVINAYLALLSHKNNLGSSNHIYAFPSYIAVMWDIGRYETWHCKKVSIKYSGYTQTFFFL